MTEIRSTASPDEQAEYDRLMEALEEKHGEIEALEKEYDTKVREVQHELYAIHTEYNDFLKTHPGTGFRAKDRGRA